MGQAFGVPEVHGGMRPFANLPKEAMQSLWTSYNLLGEGWGLAWAEFKSIFKGASYLMGMGFTDDQLLDLFNAFDTDANGLVDALEMLITLALASGALPLLSLSGCLPGCLPAYLPACLPACLSCDVLCCLQVD